MYLIVASYPCDTEYSNNSLSNSSKSGDGIPNTSAGPAAPEAMSYNVNA
jgi:hypothetical protein